MYTVWKSVAIEPLCLPAMLKCLQWDFSSCSLIPRPKSVASSEYTNGAYNHKANQVEVGIKLQLITEGKLADVWVPQTYNW